MTWDQVGVTCEGLEWSVDVHLVYSMLVIGLVSYSSRSDGLVQV